MFKFVFHAAAMIAAISFFAPAPASASHKSPLYAAADEYRDAVKDFERAVLRSRYIERFQERVVDDLEDSTSDLRSAARRADDLGRLLAQWNEVQLLHRNVESVVFGNPACPSRPDLIGPWERVNCAFAEVALQMEQVQCVDPIPSASFRYPMNSVPVCPVPSYRIPVHPVPSDRAPSYRAPSYRVPGDSFPNYQTPQNRVPSHGVPANPAPGFRNPTPSIPNYRVPDSRVPQSQLPERVLPETLPPPSRVPNEVQPSNWDPNRRSPSYVPSTQSPYRGSSRSAPSRSYEVQSDWMRASSAARTFQRAVPYQGVNATTIASLIAGLID